MDKGRVGLELGGAGLNHQGELVGSGRDGYGLHSLNGIDGLVGSGRVGWIN